MIANDAKLRVMTQSYWKMGTHRGVQIECCGLNLSIPQQVHVLDTRSITCSAILMSVGTLGGRVWLWEVCHQGGPLEVMHTCSYSLNTLLPGCPQCEKPVPHSATTMNFPKH